MNQARIIQTDNVQKMLGITWLFVLYLGILVSGNERPRTPHIGGRLPIGPGLYPAVVNPDTDPSDISTFADSCGGDVTGRPSLQNMFAGMFMDDLELDDLVKERKKELRRERRRNRRRYVKTNRLRKTIGRVSMATKLPGVSSCCETRLEVTAPGMVMVDGRSMPVVHMNHSYQFVQEGVCEKPASRCRDTGICTQIYKYAFMLLYDRGLMNAVNPPVRFAQVQVKSHCECMNIGRRTMHSRVDTMGNST